MPETLADLSVTLGVDTVATRLPLYSAHETAAVLDRMAQQAAFVLQGHARVEAPAVVIGIRRRGAPIADALTQRLVHRYGVRPPQRVDLSVKRYADDLTLLHPFTQLTDEPALAQLDLRGRSVLLVDDVLYTGLSMLRVLEHLSHREPARMHIAVLANRGGLRVPVHADVIGVHLQVAPHDIVECHVPPFEPEWGITVLKPLLSSAP